MLRRGENEGELGADSETETFGDAVGVRDIKGDDDTLTLGLSEKLTEAIAETDIGALSVQD